MARRGKRNPLHAHLNRQVLVLLRPLNAAIRKTAPFMSLAARRIASLVKNQEVPRNNKSSEQNGLALVSNIELASEILPVIDLEYRRYIATKTILTRTLCYAPPDDPKLRTKAKDLVERWILSTANRRDDANAVFPKEMSASPNDEPNIAFVHNFIKVGLGDQSKAEQLLRFFVSTIREFPMSEGITDCLSPPVVTVAKPIVTIQYGAMTRMMREERYRRLISKGNFGDLILTCLRYASIISSSSHWSAPLAIYKYSSKKYNVSLEGFASPFNSQLLMTDGGGEFCSLFPDTDKIYGSVGEFFQTELVGRNSMVNPPYVIDIMGKVADKCIKDCIRAKASDRKIRIFLLVAGKSDRNETYMRDLVGSAFTKHAEQLFPGRYYYYDTSLQEKPGKQKVIAKAHATGFVLSHGFSDEAHNYGDVWSRMKI